jgi:hypothetical protein
VIICLFAIGHSCYGQAKKRVRRGHLTVTPGIDFATMRSQDTNGTKVNFPDAVNWRLGAGFEIPFRSRKWAFMIEPAYQQYKATSPYTLIYNSLETPMGFRRYFAVGPATALFADGMFVLDIPFNYSIEIAPRLNFVSSGARTNFTAGAGIVVRRFTLEYRFYSQRTSKDDTDSFIFNYNKRSIIVGFRLY